MLPRFGCGEPVAQPPMVPLNSTRIKQRQARPINLPSWKTCSEIATSSGLRTCPPGNCASAKISAAIPPRALLDILPRRLTSQPQILQEMETEWQRARERRSAGVGAKRLARQLCAHAPGNSLFPADPGWRPGLTLKFLASPQAPPRLICERAPGHLRTMAGHRFMHGVVRCGSSSGVSSATVPSGRAFWRCLLARLTRLTGSSPCSLRR